MKGSNKNKIIQPHHLQGKCSKINNASCCGRIDFEENEMNLTKIGSCRVRICRFQIAEFLQKKFLIFQISATSYTSLNINFH